MLPTSRKSHKHTISDHSVRFACDTGTMIGITQHAGLSWSFGFKGIREASRGTTGNSKSVTQTGARPASFVIHRVMNWPILVSSQQFL